MRIVCPAPGPAAEREGLRGHELCGNAKVQSKP